MRFERGARVEALIKKKNLERVWLSAEVVSYNNKDTYTVRCFRGRYKKDLTEKLPLEAVRPHPPSLPTPEVWCVGDYVEAFHDYCWRTAFIQEDMGSGNYFVHFLGSIDDLIVEKSDIRVRQQWKDDEWVLLSKDSGICDDIFVKLFKRTQMQKQGDANNGVQHVMVKPKSLKRSPSAAGLYSDDDSAQSISKRRRAAKDKLEIEDSYSSIGKKVRFIINGVVETSARDRNI